MNHVILNVKTYNGKYDCYATIAGYDHFELSFSKESAIQRMKEIARKRYGNDVKITIHDTTEKTGLRS